MEAYLLHRIPSFRSETMTPSWKYSSGARHLGLRGAVCRCAIASDSARPCVGERAHFSLHLPDRSSIRIITRIYTVEQLRFTSWDLKRDQLNWAFSTGGMRPTHLFLRGRCLAGGLSAVLRRLQLLQLLTQLPLLVLLLLHPAWKTLNNKSSFKSQSKHWPTIKTKALPSIDDGQ